MSDAIGVGNEITYQLSQDGRIVPFDLGAVQAKNDKRGLYAAMLMQGMLSNPSIIQLMDLREIPTMEKLGVALANDVLKIADELIKKLEE